jgi:hypothetical protein
MTKRKQLRNAINSLENERKELLYYQQIGKNVEYTAMEISDIEYKIVCLEDQLDFENRMMPFKIMLYGFIIIAINIIVWTCLVK